MPGRAGATPPASMVPADPREHWKEAVMASPAPASPEQRFRTLQFICWGFVVALGIYLVLARALASQGTGPTGFPAFLPWALVALAGFAILAAPFVASLGLRAAERRDDPEARANAYQQSVVAAFALREAAGIIGIVVTLLTGHWLWSAGLTGAAALSMATGWPTRAAFDRFVEPTAPRPIA